MLLANHTLMLASDHTHQEQQQRAADQL